MKPETLNKFLNRKVRLHLKNGTIYTGEMQGFDGDALSFLDKFGNEVLVDYGSIASVASLDEGGDDDRGD